MSEIPEIKIVMVGPRGVGKTSLLAATYESLKKTFPNMTRDAQTSRFLSERLRELRELGESKIDEPFTPSGGGLGGTADEVQFGIEIDFDGDHNNDCKLTFIDLPGGWYLGENKNNSETSDKRVKDAHCIFYAVDANALMEKYNGKDFNERINYVDVMMDNVRRCIKKGDMKPIIFTLVRAESYRNKSGILYDTFRDKFKEILKYLTECKSPIYLTHVETVGCLKFNRYKPSNNSQQLPVPEYILESGPNRGYNPKNCEVPLQIMLKYALIQTIEKIKETIAIKHVEVEEAEPSIFCKLIPFKLDVEVKYEKHIIQLGNAYNQYNKLNNCFDKFNSSLKDNTFEKL